MDALLLLISLLLGNSNNRTVPEQVDKIEVNTFDTGYGKTLTQVIVWGWNEEYTRHDVMAWFILAMNMSSLYVKETGGMCE